MPIFSLLLLLICPIKHGSSPILQADEATPSPALVGTTPQLPPFSQYSTSSNEASQRRPGSDPRGGTTPRPTQDGLVLSHTALGFRLPQSHRQPDGAQNGRDAIKCPAAAWSNFVSPSSTRCSGAAVTQLIPRISHGSLIILPWACVVMS
ncbi:hypothetical protein CCMA1212_006689 [Trichoderma ghanense]|uniref:Secreted protein n=1 Tax=Trichoderma ghanense TaxID=65468 RepID=A0ABY2H130_9HYPO